MSSRNPFTQIMMNKPKKNKFDLSQEKKLSMKFGNLYPVLLHSVIPADSYRCKTETFMRFAPMLAPVMHRIDAYMHYFFVPNRILWENWEDFITDGDDATSVQRPNYSAAFPSVKVTAATKTQFEKGKLADYMGVPVMNSNTSTEHRISALPFRAYQFIYNEYYRDQNLTPKVKFETKDGDATTGFISDEEQTAITALQERAWQKDYFTSALPWTQKTGEAQIPVTSNVQYQATSLNINTSGGNATGDLAAQSGQLTTGVQPSRIENISQITADVAINDLRKSTALQRFLERAARGGTRYREQIMAHFGVQNADNRNSIPTYLGGGKQRIQISEVLNHTGTNAQETPPAVNIQGDMAGHGISVGQTNAFQYNVKEHGYIIGILSVIPKATYQTGLHKEWTKFDRFDFYWPDFAQLGEQPVYREELYTTFPNDAMKSVVFGYQQRYAEYKFANQGNSVHGDFKDTLDFWHLGRQFSSAPFLNQTFIKCRPRIDIFAVQDGTDYIWCQLFHKIDALRPIPYYNIPELG